MTHALGEPVLLEITRPDNVSKKLIRRRLNDATYFTLDGYERFENPSIQTQLALTLLWHSDLRISLQGIHDALQFG